MPIFVHLTNPLHFCLLYAYFLFCFVYNYKQISTFNLYMDFVNSVNPHSILFKFLLQPYNVSFLWNCEEKNNDISSMSISHAFTWDKVFIFDFHNLRDIKQISITFFNKKFKKS